MWHNCTEQHVYGRFGVVQRLAVQHRHTDGRGATRLRGLEHGALRCKLAPSVRIEWMGRSIHSVRRVAPVKDIVRRQADEVRGRVERRARACEFRGRFDVEPVCRLWIPLDCVWAALGSAVDHSRRAHLLDEGVRRARLGQVDGDEPVGAAVRSACCCM